MAQSSNYKQYNRGTRILTEESGFAGGILWTDNNIDATHLKTIVNCDYDDTTGYLKTRDPFAPINSTVVSFDDPQLLAGYQLLGAYNVCPFDMDNEETTQRAGWLYIFAMPQKEDDLWTVSFNNTTVKCIFKPDEDSYFICELSLSDSKLRNINIRNLLLRYENYLYSLGSDTTNEESWQQVFRVESHSVNDAIVYTLRQLDYTEEVLPKINNVTLLEARLTGFNAARGEDTFKYSSTKIDPTDTPEVLGFYITDANGTVVASPKAGKLGETEEYVIHVPVAYTPVEGSTHYLGVFQLKDVVDEDATIQLADPWEFKQLVSSEDYDGEHRDRVVEFVFKYRFNKKKTILYFTYYGSNPEYADKKKTEYILTTKEPDDWSSSYLNYYKKDSLNAFVKLTNFETWTQYTYYRAEEVNPSAYDSDALAYFQDSVITGDSLQNLKVKTYALDSAYGNCIWKNRMCLWGVSGNYNCLFLSEIDNFYYYPVPHNVALFDTNVISCIPYKDSLLVFTADKIYRLIESNDGSLVQSVVQNDMPLSNADAAYLTAIKNMVLFKSGNYFYMIVPKTQSLTDELSIAPIYKNIAGFLNTLDKSTQEMLQLLYPEYRLVGYDTDGAVTVLNGAPCAVYSEQDTVHILYDVLATASSNDDDGNDTVAIHYFKMFLNYNTNLRAWTFYLVDTTEYSLEVAALTTTRAMSFVRVNKKDSSFNIVTQQQSVENTVDRFRILLDTGYRTLSSSTQKRFREIQLKLYNATENTTACGTSFLVDGVWRRSYTKLTEFITADNVVSLTPELDLNTFIVESTLTPDSVGVVNESPGSDAIELSSWTLNFSHFKRGAPVTVRIPVSGKGFNPRFILMIPDAVDITINEINWVYRLMHGR